MDGNRQHAHYFSAVGSMAACHGHGTHVSGTIAGNGNDGNGVMTIANGVLPLHLFGAQLTLDARIQRD